MNVISFAIIIGTLLGIFSTIVVVAGLAKSNWLLKSRTVPARFVIRLPLWVAMSAFPFSWFVGFIVGGNFGGAIAASVLEKFDLSSGVIIPIGIAAGIAFCSAFFPIVSALITSVICRCIQRKRFA